MSVKKITADDLRRMNGSEGLILQGCGGDLQEWVDGISEELAEKNILLDGTKFKAENCRAFENGNLICLLFPFDDSVKVDTGRLAVWRLQTHDVFGGTWLSDYVNNQLGGFVLDESKLDRFNRELEKITEDMDISDIHASPDFQCDQTGGFPVSLCVCWDKGKAWLELNESLIMDRDDTEMNYYRQCCADYGIRPCCDTEQFNALLRELGEDAVQSAELYDEDDQTIQL